MPMYNVGGRLTAVPQVAQRHPAHLGQHVVDLIEQLVRLIEPARSIGTPSRLAVPVLPLVEGGVLGGRL